MNYLIDQIDRGFSCGKIETSIETDGGDAPGDEGERAYRKHPVTGFSGSIQGGP